MPVSAPTERGRCIVGSTLASGQDASELISATSPNPARPNADDRLAVLGSTGAGLSGDECGRRTLLTPYSHADLAGTSCTG
jgi:hypothetical protein